MLKVMILCLFTGLNCVKVLKYKPSLDGSFTISNVSLDNMAELSLCLRVFSYSFSSHKEMLVQSLVAVGERPLLGTVTHQHCRDCDTSESSFLCFYLHIMIFFLSPNRYEVFCFLGTWESERILWSPQI